MSNHIKRKKSKGILIIEPLENSYNDLKDGDEYVHLGKHNKVLYWGSHTADDEKVGRVIWDYGVEKRDKIVCKFSESEYAEYLLYANLMSKTIKGEKE